MCSLYVQKVGDYVKSTSGLDIKKKAELIRKINNSKSLNELFTLIRREYNEFRMFNQPVLTGITQIISDLKPVESEQDVPFERVKIKAREAILASSEDFRKNGTVGKYEEKVIREINKCKSLSEIFSIIGRENINLENFSQYKATSVTPGVLEIKQIKNKRELPFERIKDMAINSVLAVNVEIDKDTGVESVVENLEVAENEIEEVIEAAVDEVMSEFESGQMPQELVEIIYNENTEQDKVDIVQDYPNTDESVTENPQPAPECEKVSINNETINNETIEVFDDSYTNNIDNIEKEVFNHIKVEMPVENVREKVRQAFKEQIMSKNAPSDVKIEEAEVLTEVLEVIDKCDSLDQIFKALKQEKIEISMKGHSDASCVSHRELSKKVIDDKEDAPHHRLKQKVKNAVRKS